MYCDFSIYKKAIELYRPKLNKTGFLLYKEYINREKHDYKNP